MNEVIRILMLICIVVNIAFDASCQDLFEKLGFIKNAIWEKNYVLADSALRCIETQCIENDNDTIKLLYNETKAQSLFFLNNYEQCIPYITRTLHLYEKIDLRSINYIESFLVLGISYQKTGDLTKAEKYYRRGLLKTNFVQDCKKYEDDFLLNLGNLYLAQADTILAQECYRGIKSHDIFSLADGSLPGDDLLDSSELEAVELRKEGKFTEALAIYNTLIDTFKVRLRTRSNEYIRLLYSKAIVLGINLGDVQAAISVCEEAISMKDYFPYDEDIAGCYGKLLQFLAYEGKKDELETRIPEARAYLNTGDNAYTLTAQMYRLIGNGAYWNKHYDMAIPYYEKYLSFNVREEGNSFVEIPNMLAVAYILTDNSKQANILLSKILDKYSHELDELPQIKSLILHNYGRSFMLLGDKTQALKLFLESNSIFRQLYNEDNPKTIQYIRECQG